jgi:hypothetical protein
MNFDYNQDINENQKSKQLTKKHKNFEEENSNETNENEMHSKKENSNKKHFEKKHSSCSNSKIEEQKIDETKKEISSFIELKILSKFVRCHVYEVTKKNKFIT